MSDDLRIKLLGGLGISRGGTPLSGFVSSKATALLAYLAISAEPHPREALAGLFWGESTEEDARASLRVVLSNLRRTLGREFLATDRISVAFNRDTAYWLDVEEFERCARVGAAGPGGAVASWRRAVELYQGDLLEGVSVGGAPGFEEWLTARREHLRQLAVAALDGLIADATGRAATTDGSAYLNRLLALDPWREDAHRQLMRLLVHEGRRNAALLQYQHCRQLLADELGIAPEAETTNLYEAILNGELASEPPKTEVQTAWPPAAPVDGRHASVGPHTSFIGREIEVQQIVARLEDPACRLLTLIGPGGAGKSRLALRASGDRRLGYQDGVHVVPLAPVGEPDHIAPAIGAAAGANIAGPGDPQRQLLRFLQDKELLLVLDNFEHLIDGAPLLNEILAEAPQVKLLVTSRERLALSAEWLMTVQGLPVSDRAGLDGASPAPAAQLFIERARQVQPGLTFSNDSMTSVDRICRLLDGSPLGIELAAAWTRTHSCDEIARRIEENLDFLTVPMRDTPERHHSLRAVFTHSWALLDRRSQAMLQALSLFRGGFFSNAAEAVAGASQR
ncbi:MAG TPA: BTAD domain-containing putative transcriptional regulator, partial [Alphaproteobacteria bacterium]|nr:BTAD domain-containing putative transcriptional regulator [Alphaproteobacteria bacterium]